MSQIYLRTTRLLSVLFIFAVAAGFSANTLANVNLGKLQEKVGAEQKEEEDKEAEEAQQRKLAAEAKRQSEEAEQQRRERMLWRNWGWYGQLNISKLMPMDDAGANAGVSEVDSNRFGLSLGCCKDKKGNASRFNLVSGMGVGLRLFFDDKAYEYQRTDSSSAVEAASATASGYGLLLHYKFLGIGFNQLSLDESLEFDTINYNPGDISENMLGAYFDFGKDFYNLSLGLEFISASSASEFINDSDKLALSFGLGLIN